MKGKKVKNIRKGIKVYSSEFGFREPYQVLVEGEFLNQSLKHRLNIKEKISECFDGQVKLMITTCTIQDLRNMGEDYTGSVVAAKRFVRRRCPHQTAIKGIDCMKEIIGPTNEFRYCVASQNLDFNKQLLDIPATPLLTLSRDTLLLSPLSAASKAKINKAASVKLLPSADELKRLKAVTGLDLEALKEPQLPLHKRKKAKGPNPLSVKKKKPEPKPQKSQVAKKTDNSQPEATPSAPNPTTENPSNADEVAASIKPKAKRKRRRPTKKGEISTSEALESKKAKCDDSD